MNSLSKLSLLLGLLLSSCKPNSFISQARLAEVDENNTALSTVHSELIIVGDSLVLYKSREKDILSFNPYTGKEKNKFIISPKFENKILDTARHFFPDENLTLDTTSTEEDEAFPKKRLYSFNLVNDTLYILYLQNLTAHKEMQIKDKIKKIKTHQSFPVIIRTTKELKTIDYFFPKQDSAAKQNIDIGMPFTCNDKTYYFGNTYAFIFKTPGQNQLRVYRQNPNGFVPEKDQDQTLPFTSAFFERMQVDSNTSRSSIDFEFKLKTINNKPYFTNLWQLSDLSSNEDILDGVSNDFMVRSFTVTDDEQYLILAQDTTSHKRFSLKIYNKEKELSREQNLPIEKNEKVIAGDLSKNQVVLIVQKDENLYFKIFDVKL